MATVSWLCYQLTTSVCVTYKAIVQRSVTDSARWRCYGCPHNHSRPKIAGRDHRRSRSARMRMSCLHPRMFVHGCPGWHWQRCVSTQHCCGALVVVSAPAVVIVMAQHAAARGRRAITPAADPTSATVALSESTVRSCTDSERSHGLADHLIKRPRYCCSQRRQLGVVSVHCSCCQDAGGHQPQLRLVRHPGRRLIRSVAGAITQQSCAAAGAPFALPATRTP